MIPISDVDVQRLCACGKPATHLFADEESQEWACLVPDPNDRGAHQWRDRANAAEADLAALRQALEELGAKWRRRRWDVADYELRAVLASVPAGGVTA